MSQEAWKKDFFAARTKLAELSELRKQRSLGRPEVLEMEENIKRWESNFLLWKARPDAKDIQWDKIEGKIAEECAKYNRYADGSEKGAKLAAVLAGAGVTTFVIVAATQASLSSKAVSNLMIFGGGFPLAMAVVALVLARLHRYMLTDSYQAGFDPLQGLVPVANTSVAAVEEDKDLWKNRQFLAAHTTFAKLDAITEKYNLGSASVRQQSRSYFYEQMSNPDANWLTLNATYTFKYVAFEKSVARDKNMKRSAYALAGAVISTAVVAATCSSSFSTRAMNDLIVFGVIFPALGCVLLALVLEMSNKPASSDANARSTLPSTPTS